VRNVETHKAHRIRWIVILSLLMLLVFMVVFVGSTSAVWVAS